MSVFAGPELLINDSLVLSLDSRNIKSLQYRPSTADHGISDWYCFVSGTVTYSCSEPNTTIYQITSGGTISTVVSPSSSPQRGTFSITAGNRYYGDKPIFLCVEDGHHSIAPISLSAKNFMYLANRSGSEAGTIYFYSPYASATVTMYTAGTGINGTPTSTISLSIGQSGTFTISTLNWFFFTSTSPVIGTAGQLVSGFDKTILSPAVLTSYQRYLSGYGTIIAGTPTTIGSYVIADTTYPVMSQQIADGGGGDTTQGLGYEYLCDRYSWGNVLSDYVIVAPYPNTIVSTYYWSGSAWVVWESHSLSGTRLSPAQVQRDGTTGTGVTSTIISGLANNMAGGATLWKWEGNNPFYLAINDNADDEMSMLGWMNSRNYRTSSDTDSNWYDTSGTGNSGTLVNGPQSSNKDLMFTYQNWQSVTFANTTSLQFLNTSPYTLEVWVYPTRNPGASNYTGIFDRESNPGTGRDGYNIYFLGSAGSTTYFTTERFTSGTNTIAQVTLDQSVSVNNWSHLVSTYNGSTLSLYRNGSLVSSTSSTGNLTNTSKTLTVGVRGGQYFDGKISCAKIYNKALTSLEVNQNFNAIRGRFGI